ncbi:hypothetical protein Q1695_012396 [Nippostrongylus brasiliensis]|nr:hypothetical protein Q1695_012396 [Nippostrongylus brasiliensis]
MATVLRTQKALMTRRINAISQWIQDTAPLLERPTDGEQRRRAHQYRMILSTCEEHIERLEASLNTLAAAFDNTDATSPDEEEFKKYIDNAMDFVMTLHEHKDKILRSLSTIGCTNMIYTIVVCGLCAKISLHYSIALYLAEVR